MIDNLIFTSISFFLCLVISFLRYIMPSLIVRKICCLFGKPDWFFQIVDATIGLCNGQRMGDPGRYNDIVRFHHTGPREQEELGVLTLSQW